MIEFKGYHKIPHLDTLEISITQKIHGTNAHVYIYKTQSGLDLICGSRNRWISIGDDNNGFAKFVLSNKQKFIDSLGEGHHFGEWAGPGINSGEGLKEKIFFLFNWRKFSSLVDLNILPENVSTVPVILSSTFDAEFTLNSLCEGSMNLLRDNGSLICKGYMKPEGIVIQIGSQYYKKTFENEEISWKQTEKTVHIKPEEIDVSHLLQPLRLEKLLSRDEKYMREYPVSLKSIFSDYVKDLEDENKFSGMQILETKKALGRHLFRFVKEFISIKLGDK